MVMNITGLLSAFFIAGLRSSRLLYTKKREDKSGMGSTTASVCKCSALLLVIVSSLCLVVKRSAAVSCH